MRGALEIIILLFLGAANLLMIRLALYRLHQPTTVIVWALKGLSSSLSPVLCMTAVVIALMGVVLDSIPATLFGALSALLYLTHIIKITRPPAAATSIEEVFGLQWMKRVPQETKSFFLRRRYVVQLPNRPEPIFKRDLCFYKIHEYNRELLCDIWQPSKETKKSGLGFIYLHGSAWTSLDKDYGTRPFFRHLASQGHVVMDVAYRLYPETDFTGMVHDTKHAIAWLKKNAASFGVQPDKIVIGGGSAGAHVALLAAFSKGNNQLTPADLIGSDLSLFGVVSWYGQSDLTATYYHTCQHLTSHSALAQKKPQQMSFVSRWFQKKFAKDIHRLGFDKNVEPGMLAPMLGGTPEEKPEAYALFSPITYADHDCPPTLFIHGEHDILAPLEAIHTLHGRLKQAGVPVVMHQIKQTDHAFDLILPKISPSAHNAIYEVERFLAARLYST